VAFFDLLVPRLTILDKNGDLVPLGPNLTPLQTSILGEVERQIEAKRPIRLIVLKARQMGCSTITEAMAFQMCQVFPNYPALVLAHLNRSAASILKMTHRYWTHAPAPLRLIHGTTSSRISGLAWDNGSTIEIATAKNEDEGRGRTIQFIHCSEAAFYPAPETLLGGLNQVLPRSRRSFQIVESTANGIGDYFYDQWQAAKTGDIQHVPLFFAWWQHPFYTADYIGLGHLADRPLTDLDDEELILSRVFTRLGMDARDTRARLLWRRDVLRTECNGDLDYFHQEYPSTDDEAFISTGRNVFSRIYLDHRYEPLPGEVGRMFRSPSGHVGFSPDDQQGYTTIYKHPRPSADYIVGGDASRAAIGDYACAQVLDRRTREQVAVFHQRGLSASAFAQEMMKLGVYYNDAMLIPETNLSGGAVAEILRTTYPNVFIYQKANNVPGMHASYYGWPTSHQTKAEVISYLQQAFSEAAALGNGILIHHKPTYVELAGYVVDEKGKYGNGNGTDHDDTVMALGIGLTGIIYEAANLPTQLPAPPSPRGRTVPNIPNPRMAEAIHGSRTPTVQGPNVLTENDIEDRDLDPNRSYMEQEIDPSIFMPDDQDQDWFA